MQVVIFTGRSNSCFQTQLNSMKQLLKKVYNRQWFYYFQLQDNSMQNLDGFVLSGELQKHYGIQILLCFSYTQNSKRQLLSIVIESIVKQQDRNNTIVCKCQYKYNGIQKLISLVLSNIVQQQCQLKALYFSDIQFSSISYSQITILVQYSQLQYNKYHSRHGKSCWGSTTQKYRFENFRNSV